MRSETFTHSSIHSTITNERILKMSNPRPVDGRATNYGYQGSLNDSRLGSQTGDFKHPGSNNLNSTPLYTYIDVITMQTDFHNAYLNADITEDAYVVQPRGLEDP